MPNVTGITEAIINRTHPWPVPHGETQQRVRAIIPAPTDRANPETTITTTVPETIPIQTGPGVPETAETITALATTPTQTGQANRVDRVTTDLATNLDTDPGTVPRNQDSATTVDPDVTIIRHVRHTDVQNGTSVSGIRFHRRLQDLCIITRPPTMSL